MLHNYLPIIDVIQS